MKRVFEQAETQAVVGYRELHAVLNLAPTALFFASLPDFSVRFANAAFAGRFGALDGGFASIDEWLAVACANPEQRRRARALWQALSQADAFIGSAPPAMELDLRCADGTIVTTLHRAVIDHREGVAIASFEDISPCKAVEHALRRVAHEDPLTELANRRALTERWQVELRCMERRKDTMLALILLDLDRFKSVNDDFGHDAGDEVLKTVAGRLRNAVPPTAMVCRLGGDEFAVLVPGMTDERQVEQLAEDICQSLSQPQCWKGHQLALGVSLGMGCYPRDAADLQGLMRRADGALYRRKRGGRGGWAWCGPPEVRIGAPATGEVAALSRLRTV
ncbi:GGDEF domain-containing protein [Rhizobium sp. CSW-27]|uniref:GGDEF domain-containing protein n=1 Tax=Rhizobium sp. CSW-27 TaxID=2839985 RepID=UPI001C026CDD|nr:GGDEF domain-containing protein [Rhizobium sp. CSW-27]MBT9371090.1 GGDEF domain-containing protein [Rhizobium sp. CSW-27]